MKWLLEADRAADLETLRMAISKIGGELALEASPVEMEEGSFLFEVFGPEEFAEKAAAITSVRKISPSSELTFFNGPARR